jgi:phospholipase C
VAEPAVAQGDRAQLLATATPIKHLVVIFGENVSFDHYFGTYPVAQNLAGEVPFHAATDTPLANNLSTPLDPTRGFSPIAELDLLHANPNSSVLTNGEDASNPFRLGPEHAATPSMGHGYTDEQLAAHAGAMDRFPAAVGVAGPPPGVENAATRGLVMAYYDGNTVGTFWRYAQEFALNDNSWSSMFGPSTPGAINLISGQTNGVGRVSPDFEIDALVAEDGNGGLSVVADPNPIDDVCSGAGVSLRGRNIGDLLNERGISWGWFQGGFDLSLVNENGSTGCERSSDQTVPDALVKTPRDYVPHHQPFQFYASTANPSHARPSGVLAIGHSLAADDTHDPANHQYDSHDFFDALAARNLPAVSYLKAPGFQDAHAGNSNPIDEQHFVEQVVSALRASPEWASTAIVLAYDDSDGWYDHQAPPIVNPSFSESDALNGPGTCTQGLQQAGPAPSVPLLGVDGKPAQGRCGYGTRLPLLVLSPFARKNFIDHTLTDQTSILRFIEDNWLDGARIQPGGSFDAIAGSIEHMFEL